MRILTWNICCLPKKINAYHNPKKAIEGILNKINNLNPTVIKLQEVFDYKIQEKTVDRLKKSGYNVHISDNDHNFISKNGLLTATRYPIISTNEYVFKNKTSVEYMIDKGIITTGIQYPNNDSMLYLHNTHIQSDSMYGFYKECKEIRDKQFEETIEYIKTYGDVSQIFSGDFNDDFDDLNLNEMIQMINFQKNPHKIITFPEHHTQLDYILINMKDPNKVEFKICNTKLSDHYPFYVDI